MEFSNYLFSSAEIIGIVAASVSGCIIAAKCKFDLFGVILCAFFTSLGGGILRDILIGDLPPRAFTNYFFPLASLLTSLAVFVVFKLFRNKLPQKQSLMRALFFIFDAVGLASFSMTGVQIGIASGHEKNAFLCIVLGMVTAVGGGMIRDVITARIPLVLREQIYATASILGSAVYYFAVTLGANSIISMYVSMAIIVIIRLLSIHYKWHLPVADEK